jgi:hypothetical protein
MTITTAISGSGPNGSSIPPSYTWATKPNAASYPGAVIRLTDVGGGTGSLGGGNLFFSNGTRWKPINGSIVLDSVDTPNAGVADTTEQQLNPNHVVIPAGAIGLYDRILLRGTMSKSGTSDTATIRVRFGPLGTTADPVVATIASLATTAQSIGFLQAFKRASATTFQKEGNGSTDTSFSGASTTAFPAPVAVSNLDTTPMYLSITSQLTAGTEIVTLQDYTLELLATDSQ